LLVVRSTMLEVKSLEVIVMAIVAIYST